MKLAHLRGRVRIAALGLALVACNADRLVAPSVAPAEHGISRTLVAGGAVVISQIYGAGGNSGAKYNADYIELFNRGDQPVDISGWKLLYGSSTGQSWTNTYTLPAGKTIGAGKYFLIQLAGGSNGVALPVTADAGGTGINMGGSAGKIVLSSSSSTVFGTVACPSDPTIVDRVAFGAASGTGSCDVEWGRAPAPSTTNATFRKTAGCIATGSASDFEALAALPRNSQTAQNTCDGVTPPVEQVVTTVTLSPQTASLAAGGSITFTPTVKDQFDQPMSNVSLTWTSSDPTIATVTQAGVVTTLAAGTTTIAATSANGKVGSATLTVTPVIPKPLIVISQVYGGGGNSGAVLKNDYIELLNPGIAPVDVTGWSVQVWSGSNNAWQVTPISGVIQPGQYYLVQEAQGAAGTTNLPTPDATGTILMSATSSRVVLSQQAVQLADACPANVIDRVGYGTSGCASAWGVGDVQGAGNTAAILRRTGGCTYTADPVSDFTAGTPNPRNSLSATNLCVPAGPLDHVLITGSATSVQVGSLVQYIAFGQDVNNLPVSNPVTTWSTSSPAVTVDNTGKVIGVSVSTNPVTLTATVVAGGITKSATRSITVAPAPEIVTVNVTPATWSLEVAQTKSFTASAVDDQGNTLTPVVTWSSADPAIASVDANGTITGVTVGTTTLTATTSNGKTGSAAITVTPKSGSLSLQPHTAPVPVGFQTGIFIGSGVDGQGNPITNSTVAWSTSDPAIATINPNTGILTAVSAGTAQVTATSKNDGVTKASTPVVTVVAATSSSARTGHNTDLGVPTDADATDDLIIARRQYTISYNPRRGVNNWVSWNLDASHQGSTSRCDCFSADPAVRDAGYTAFETNDWNNVASLQGGATYSRGHMSPSADWNVALGDNAPTFYLSNMLPQNQNMNAGPWGVFEDYLRSRTTGATEIYIISGGIFTKGRTGGQDGFGTIAAAGKIAIPDSIWKIAVIVPDTRDVTGIAGPSDVEVIAINTPNETPASGATWQTYRTSIAKIESSTGYDFLSSIPEQVQCRLESRDCAPVAKLAASAATADEGQSLSFDASASSDVDGDALTYAWQVNGQPAGSSANLSYTFTNNGSYTVSVTVSDGKGGSSVASSTVTIANVAPTAGIVGPDRSLEGAAFTVSAGAVSDPSIADVAAGFEYAFDCGSGFGAWTKASSTSCSVDDNGSAVVRVKVRDQDGGESPVYEQAVTVDDVPPTATLVAPASVAEGSSIALALTNASDVSAADRAQGFSYEFDCGAGAGWQATSSASMTCTTSDDGSRTVRARITDKDGGQSEYTAAVAVTNVAPAVSLQASSLSIASGGSVSLTGTFDDPGADAPWQWALDLGGGSANQSGSASSIAPISRSAIFLKAGTYAVALTVSDKDGAAGTSSTLNVQVSRVALPGLVTPSVINLNDRSSAVITFAVLGSASFDASKLDAATAMLGEVGVTRKPNGSLFTAMEDVNGDGIPDQLLRFDRTALVAKGVLSGTTAELSLLADLQDGRQVEVKAPVQTK